MGCGSVTVLNFFLITFWPAEGPLQANRNKKGWVLLNCVVLFYRASYQRVRKYSKLPRCWVVVDKRRRTCLETLLPYCLRRHVIIQQDWRMRNTGEIVSLGTSLGVIIGLIVFCYFLYHNWWINCETEVDDINKKLVILYDGLKENKLSKLFQFMTFHAKC